MVAATEAIGNVLIEGAADVVGVGVVPVSMGPVPLISQERETSGKALMTFCTTSRLGLLRSLRIWLITGRPTPIKSAN